MKQRVTHEHEHDSKQEMKWVGWSNVAGLVPITCGCLTTQHGHSVMGEHAHNSLQEAMKHKHMGTICVHPKKSTSHLLHSECPLPKFT